MTIEKFLNKTANEIAAMSNEELDTYFKPFYPLTRPEEVQKELKMNDKQTTYIPRKKVMTRFDPEKEAKKAKINAMLAAMGEKDLL